MKSKSVTENQIPVTLGALQWSKLAAWARGRSNFLHQVSQTLTEALVRTSGPSLTLKRPFDTWHALISVLQESALGEGGPDWLPGIVVLIVSQVSSGLPHEE